MSPDVTAYVLADLAIILVALRIGNRAAAALSQPPVVGEIVAGILIGPTVLGGRIGSGMTEGAGLVDRLYPPEAFAFLSLIGQIGLVFYMFLVGLEFDQRLLAGRRRQMCSVALAAGLTPIAAGFAVAPLFAGETWRPEGVGDVTFALFLGAGLGATALPVMARLLQDKGLMGTPVAAMSLGAAGLVTVAVFLVVAAASASASGGGITADVGGRLALTILFVATLAVLVRPAIGWALARIDAAAHLGSIVAGLLGLALTAGLAADRIGINALVGGFLFGLSVPATRALADAVLERLRDMVVLVLLPVFFAVSGLMTDFRQIDSVVLPGMALFLGVMILIKWGPSYLAGRFAGLAPAEASALGVLMSCGGLLVLVVGLIGLDLGIITPALHLAFVVGAIVTLVMAGPLLDHFMARVPPTPELPAPAIATLEG